MVTTPSLPSRRSLRFHDPAPCHVSSHESAEGCWQMIRRAPRALLRPFVATYEGWAEETATSCRLEVPSGIVPLIITFDAPPLLVDTPAERGHPDAFGSFVAGLHDHHALVEARGRMQGVQVNLTPIGARLLFGIPMRELANRAVALADLLGPAGHSLPHALADTPGWEARFALLDGLFTRLLADSGPPSPTVDWAWRRLHETGGQVAISTLADEIGCSRKHLADGFRDHIGLPPKTAARVLRFDRVVQSIQAGEPRRWADLAHAHGYYDQAHMVREFTGLAGVTPGEFMRRQLPEGSGVRGD